MATKPEEMSPTELLAYARALQLEIDRLRVTAMGLDRDLEGLRVEREWFRLEAERKGQELDAATRGEAARAEELEAARVEVARLEASWREATADGAALRTENAHLRAELETLKAMPGDAADAAELAAYRQQVEAVVKEFHVTMPNLRSMRRFLEVIPDVLRAIGAAEPRRTPEQRRTLALRNAVRLLVFARDGGDTLKFLPPEQRERLQGLA